jgi:hypothetical protein
MRALDLFRFFDAAKPVSDEAVWQKCLPPFLPKRTVDGQWIAYVGQLWRRKHNGSWEYRQDPETKEEWEDRAW